MQCTYHSSEQKSSEASLGLVRRDTEVLFMRQIKLSAFESLRTKRIFLSDF